MTHEEFEKAAHYWDNKEQTAMPEEALKQAVLKYIGENNTCALATGTGDYVRCTPIEYSFHDGKFWMFSEGGRESSSDWKRTVTSALPFTTSMMVLAISEACRSPAMVEPFSEEYNTHAAFKKIPLDALKKLPSPMNLFCVTPTRIDALFSDFKKDGYSVRQVLHQLA